MRGDDSKQSHEVLERPSACLVSRRRYEDVRMMRSEQCVVIGHHN
jgi:hypothetical protein